MISRNELVAMLELEEAEKKRIKIEKLKEWERTKPERVKKEFEKIKAEKEELILKNKSYRSLSSSAIGEEQVEAAELYIEELRYLGYSVSFIGEGYTVKSTYENFEEDCDNKTPYLDYVIKW